MIDVRSWTLASFLLVSIAAAAEPGPQRPPPGDLKTTVDQLDQALRQSWTEHHVQPTPRVDDISYVRRLWLDLGGRIPSVKETRTALAANGSLNRGQLIDQLLASDEFANHWGRLWTEYLTDARPFESGTHNGRLLQNYLRDAIQKKEPYDRIVRTLILGEGPSDSTGPVNFLLRYGVAPPAITGAAAEKFLGVTLKCAECHDHPHSTWKKDDFWGLAAYFARLRRMNPAEGDQDFSIVIERSRGELEVPDRTAKPNENGEYPSKTIFPKLPGAASIDATHSRRETFLNWLTAKENPYFARHAVNHVWEMMLGRPLVAKFDPVPNAKPQVDSPILDLLAKDFSEHSYDLHRLIRVIGMSEAYSRSSGAGVLKNATVDESAYRSQVENFACYAIRPLSADQLHLSLLTATGSAGDPNDGRLAQVTREEYTYDISVGTFSEPAMTPRRSLSLLNGERAREAVGLAAGSATRQYGPSPGVEHIEWLFLSLLSRRPTIEERDQLLELAGSSSGAAGLEDVAWVLINSA